MGDNPHNTFTPDGAMGITGPDYGNPYPNVTRKWAVYYREERAKRPVNIKNIQTTTGSSVVGNYQHRYELFSTFGNQKYFLRRNENSLLPDRVARVLPQTTNYMTLIGVAPYVTGNVFGVSNNNRQPDRGPDIPPTVANGTFTITGSPSPATAATGRFTVTGSHVSGTFATGSFKYYSKVTAGFDDTSDWDNNRISFGGENYILDKDGTP